MEKMEKENPVSWKMVPCGFQTHYWVLIGISIDTYEASDFELGTDLARIMRSESIVGTLLLPSPKCELFDLQSNQIVSIPMELLT